MFNIPKETLEQLPKLYANEEIEAKDVKVPLKVFNPYGIGTWYITEYDPETDTAFGLCDLGFPELGYVNVKELQSVSPVPKMPELGLEIDAHWNPDTSLAEVMSTVCHG
jgi:hypothetical protein